MRPANKHRPLVLRAGTAATLLAAWPAFTQTVPQPAQAASGPTALPAQDVRAKALKETATGPVAGYRATRSATATKTDTPLAETPQSISVITRQQLDDRGVSSVAESLRYSAGVTPGAFSYGGDVFVMRGFNVDDEGLLLDGMRAFSNVFSSSIEPYGAERIEVLRGPASVLYGLATPGGVVNIVSKRPQAETLREVGVELGSYSRRQVNADFTGKLDEAGTLLGRFTFLGRKADTQYDWTRDDRLYIAPALTWKPDAATTLTFLASYNRDHQAYVWGSQYHVWGTAADGSPVAGRPIAQLPKDFNFSGPGVGFDRRMATAGWLLEHRLNDTLTLRQNLRYADIKTDRKEVWASYFGSGLGLQADGRTLNRIGVFRPDRDRNLQLDNQAEWHFGTGPLQHTLLTGFDLRRVRFRSEIRTDGVIRPLDLFNPSWVEPDWGAMHTISSRDTTHQRQESLYAQDQVKLGEQWAFTAGLRRDRIRQDAKNKNGVETDSGWMATTGRVGAVWLAGDGWAPYASWSTSFEPVASQQGRSFDPTSGKQFEIGTRWQPVGRPFSLLASLYDLRKTNVVMTIDNVLEQKGEVRSKGGEFEFTWTPQRNWDLISALTYTDARITRSSGTDQGKSVINIPKVTASVWSMFKPAAVQGLGLGLGVRHVGDSRSSSATVRNPSSTLMDAALNYEAGPWLLALNVDNLFDKTVLTSCDAALCTVAYQRSLRARATYRW